MDRGNSQRVDSLQAHRPVRITHLRIDQRPCRLWPGVFLRDFRVPAGSRRSPVAPGAREVFRNASSQAAADRPDGQCNAAAQITKLRDQFRIDSEVVSAASKKLTQAVFGEALSPAEAVERICNDVREKGCRRPALHRAVRQGEAQAGHAPREAAGTRRRPRRGRPRVPRCHPAGPVQRRCSSSPGCCTATRRCASRRSTNCTCATGRSSASACTVPAARRRTPPRC